MTSVGVLFILGLQLMSAASVINVLRGYIQTENFITGNDNFIAIYNYQISNYFESYTLDSEIKCRHLAMVLNYSLASVDVRTSRTGPLECRVSNKGITEGIILKEKNGTYTYIRAEAKIFFPAPDGLFYLHYAGLKKTCSGAALSCPATNTTRLPVTRTERARNIVREIATVVSPDLRVCVGASRTSTSDPFTWYDNDQPFEQNGDIYSGDSNKITLAYSDQGVYRQLATFVQDLVCVYKIFDDFNWE